MGRGRQRSKRGREGQRRRYAANSPILEIEIARLGGRGDGLAEAVLKAGYVEESRPVFVPFALPGETVRARPVSDRGEGVACELIELVTPSPERIDPACRHFMSCGGCAVQHLSAETYASWKRAQVVQHLGRVGLADVPVNELHPAAPATRRRADFVLRRIGQRLIAGFHERASNRIVEIEECPVLLPEIFALLAPLRALFDSVLKPGDGVDCVVNALDNGLDVLLRLPAHPGLGFRERLAEFAEAQDLARLSYHAGDDTLPDAVPLAERRRPEIRFGQVPVSPPAGAFLQATRDGEAAIQERVRAGIGDAKSVLDLYAGCGTLCLALDGPAERVAVEGDEGLLAAIRAGADAAGLGGRVRTERRDLSQRPFAGKELGPFDAVILDPPRAGAREQCAALSASDIRRIVYVSCNPATFARDARALVDGGYSLTGVTPIDQFLWTPHIELVGHFERAAP
ncbi:class I SAM-dependent RNA methyltransferase [Nisaea acidiphila]|uniref:Class I SAM-dependent RNA methyltransferase n=1 Tax=Nisaea acidiphila TaxID=1862145 RepID=A0A9J7AZW6_9PROT|nr:class I SAM-dependent RNA methyltransferase [Nisaea acidiphila]UUX51788.1 class I SAM-dependent RNA methyltransferase [Nisaea acidiphila]